MHKQYGIDVIEKINLGGIVQWISLRSKDIEKPILLFLHGGPGTAQIAFSRKSQRLLEYDFVVVNWDQRGAGRSFNSHLNKNDMQIEKFITDAEELTIALLNRFNQKKIILVGNSWGSIIGAYLSAKRPDLIYAYVGIGQVANMEKGEIISYQFTLDEARRKNNKKAVKELEFIGKPPYKDLRSAGVQRKWLAAFNGQVYKGTAIGMFIKNMSLRDIGFFGLSKWVRGIMFSLKHLEDHQNKENLIKNVPEISVPVFFCCGRHDYNVPFELSVEYLEV